MRSCQASGGVYRCRVAVLLLTLCLTNKCGSAITFEEFVGYPFNETNGYSVFPRILDLVRGLPIPVPFPYFGKTFSYVHIEDSGYISLINVNGSVNTSDIAFLLSVTPYTQQDFPLNTSNTILSGIDWGAVVAPYWYDVDTRGSGSGMIYYKDVTRGTDADLIEEIDSLATPHLCGFTTIWALIVTWDSVGFFPFNSHLVSSDGQNLNTFQVVLATDGQRSLTVFNYAEDGINWAGGYAFGFSAGGATAGYNVGDQNRYFKLPGSFSEDIQYIDNTTGNTGTEGQWVFVLDDYPPCSSGITLSPTFGSVYGGTPITVTLPEQRDYLLTSEDVMVDILCIFDQVQTHGTAVSANVVLCVSPPMTKLGFVPFQFRIALANEDIFAGNSSFLAISGQRSYEIDVTKISSDDRQLLIFAAGEGEKTLTNVSVKWPIHFVDAEFMKPNEYTVDIHLYELDVKSLTLSDPQSPFLLKENIVNSGNYVGEIDTSMLALSSDSSTHMVVFQVSVNPSTFSTGIPRIGKWSGAFVYYTKNLADLDAECSEWYSNEPDNIGSRLLEAATPCPSTRMQANLPSSGLFEVDISSFLGSTSYHIQHLQFYHPGATTCYEQLTRTVGPSQECCYDSAGNLHTNSPGGGSVNRFGSATMASQSDHHLFDLFPYVHCCKGELRSCSSYYEVRPSDLGRNFFPPLPGWWFGDPHIVTLDGHKYTFNGKGDYILLDTDDNSFTIHGRMEEASTVDGSAASGGTVFTALAARQNDSDTVQFELHGELYPRINGVVDRFTDLNEKTFTNVTIKRVGNDSFSAAFSSGVYIEVRAVTQSSLAPYISVVIVSVPTSYQGRTRGLMGNYNGEPADDLVPRSGGEPLPLNSTLNTLHWNFGVTWIISKASQSLFTYNGDTFEDFFHPGFTPAFEPVFNDPALKFVAEEMCGGDVFCLFDIAATEDIDIGLETLMGGQEFDVIVNVSKPFTCTPPCINGACIDANVCACSAGYNGDRCDQPVITACASNPCKNGGTCSQLAGTYTCTCQNGYTGNICQSAGTVTDSNTTVILGALGGLVGLLVLIVVGAVILGLCVKLFICRKKQKYTATDCDVVEMVSIEENPAYVDVHIKKKRENNYSPNLLSAI